MVARADIRAARLRSFFDANQKRKLPRLNTFASAAPTFAIDNIGHVLYYRGGFRWSKVGVDGRLRGTHPARIDDKGRLKIPNAFRILIEKAHGNEVFVTSVTGESVLIYPMPVWLALEEKLAQVPTTSPARLKYLDRVNYYGQTADIDSQGRVVIHPRLRDAAGMTGDVDVFGKLDTLEVWNHDRFVAKLQRDQYSAEDAQALSQFGI